jgi:hypothetical protein
VEVWDGALLPGIQGVHYDLCVDLLDILSSMKDKSIMLRSISHSCGVRRHGSMERVVSCSLGVAFVGSQRFVGGASLG